MLNGRPPRQTANSTMNQAYLFLFVKREDFKKVQQRKHWAGGPHTWRNLIYMCPTYPIYVYTNEDAAIKDARVSNKSKGKDGIYFYIELSSYDE